MAECLKSAYGLALLTAAEIKKSLEDGPHLGVTITERGNERRSQTKR